MRRRPARIPDGERRLRRHGWHRSRRHALLGRDAFPMSPPELRAALEAGSIPAATLTEQLAIDTARLLTNVFPPPKGRCRKRHR